MGETSPATQNFSVEKFWSAPQGYFLFSNSQAHKKIKSSTGSKFFVLKKLYSAVRFSLVRATQHVLHASNKKSLKREIFYLRRGRESNSRMEDLQSTALPLRHHAFIIQINISRYILKGEFDFRI
jgi:hypothetical protein